MSTLVKRSNAFPSFRSMMEDFWNNDGFFVPSLFNRSKQPAVNLRETKQGYELEVAAPGFKKQDFKITSDNGMLTISAETKSEQKEENDSYVRQEFTCSSFMRSFTLPENVSEKDVKAAYEDGILKISMSKNGKELPAPKEIKID